MIDPISANLIASSFSGLAGFTMRSERDSTRVQGLDKSNSTADRSSRFSENLRAASAKSGEKVQAKNTDATGLKLSEEEKEAVRKLQAREQEVRAHEQAHMAAAGGIARGGANYTFTQGPDGKQYAIGGSVSIDTSVDSSDPEKMKQKARQIQAAALAPADPSSQDMAVAASATKMMADAQAKEAEQDRNPEKSEENGEVASGDIEAKPNEASQETNANAQVNGQSASAASLGQAGQARQDMSASTAQAGTQVNAQAGIQANAVTNSQSSQAVSVTRTGYQINSANQGNVEQASASNGVRQYGTGASSFEGANSGYAIFNGTLKFNGEMSSVLPLVGSLAKPSMNSAMKSYAQVASYAPITAQDSQNVNSDNASNANNSSNPSLSRVA